MDFRVVQHMKKVHCMIFQRVRTVLILTSVLIGVESTD